MGANHPKASNVLAMSLMIPLFVEENLLVRFILTCIVSLVEFHSMPKALGCDVNLESDSA